MYTVTDTKRAQFPAMLAAESMPNHIGTKLVTVGMVVVYQAYHSDPTSPTGRRATDHAVMYTEDYAEYLHWKAAR